MKISWEHRALVMLESGEARSMKEIARQQGVDDSYVSRMINLTTLAPDIVATILNEILPPEVTLFDLAARILTCMERANCYMGGPGSDGSEGGAIDFENCTALNWAGFRLGGAADRSSSPENYPFTRR